MSNITFTLTREKTDALLSLLSLIEGDSALSGLYHALLSQIDGRPYHFRLRQSETRHSVHEANMVLLVDKRSVSSVGG